ncbi:MAG TPA: hypothetical protein VLC55_07990, partial [Burkholderiales bacterium]|nr:hypothetical protein [Burkholderiales bacterium]
AGTAARPMPDSADEWLRGAATGDGEMLLVLEGLRGLARLGDSVGWRETLQAMEKSWFAPLAAALQAKRLAGITITSPGEARCCELSVDAADFWKFWRGPRRMG